ncbi:hypothetical protein WGP40_05530 [Brachymonas sp. G13]|uniref:hypothetical protein n=1 Tax=Brachymonas wangyanguii TaxID=3130163 RepID=UPI00307E10DE
MKHHLSLLLMLSIGLSACTSIVTGHRQIDSAAAADLAVQSAQIRAAERQERAEFRQEERESLMDQADAIQRATGGNAAAYLIY